MALSSWLIYSFAEIYSSSSLLSLSKELTKKEIQAPITDVITK